MSPEFIYRTTKSATDEDWASPEFDYLQPAIGAMLANAARSVGGPAHAARAAQQWRDHRPYLIANIRNSLGDPRWDPRGARVLSLPFTTHTDEDEGR